MDGMSRNADQNTKMWYNIYIERKWVRDNSRKIMKKRTSPIAIVAAIIAVIVIILVFVGMNRHKDDANHQNNESVTSSAESDGSDMASAETASGIDNSDISTSLPGNIVKEVLESDDTKDSERAKANVVAEATNIPDGSDTSFMEFSYENPESSDVFRYDKRYVHMLDKSYFDLQKERQEKYNLTLASSSDGNPYMVFGGNCYVYDGTDENGNAKKYIISGADVVEYDGTLNPFNTHPILRKENTCERIYLFDDETKKNEFLERRAQGKEFLQNGSTDNEWKVILNGEYLPDAYPIIDDNGNLNLSLVQLATAYNPLFTRIDKNYVYVATDWGLYSVPSTESDQATKGSCDFSKDEDGNDVYYVTDMGFGGVSGSYGVAAKAPKTREYYWVTPDDLNTILGWTVSIKGRVISVCSNPLDDSDLTGVIQKVSKTYYDLNGNIITDQE
jgi:hypothetical protein